LSYNPSLRAASIRAAARRARAGGWTPRGVVNRGLGIHETGLLMVW